MHKGKKCDTKRSKKGKRKAKARKKQRALARGPSPIVEAMTGVRY